MRLWDFLSHNLGMLIFSTYIGYELPLRPVVQAAKKAQLYRRQVALGHQVVDDPDDGLFPGSELHCGNLIGDIVLHAYAVAVVTVNEYPVPQHKGVPATVHK